MNEDEGVTCPGCGLFASFEIYNKIFGIPRPVEGDIMQCPGCGLTVKVVPDGLEILSNAQN